MTILVCGSDFFALREKRDFNVLGRKFNKLKKVNSCEQTNIEDNRLVLGTQINKGLSDKVKIKSEYESQEL